jgi:hypothetical protein
MPLRVVPSRRPGLPRLLDQKEKLQTHGWPVAQYRSARASSREPVPKVEPGEFVVLHH